MDGGDGSVYVRKFAEGEFSGYGNYRFGPVGPWTGESHAGHYLADYKEGHGAYFWPNGDRYVGEFADDRREGHDILAGAKGDVYVGAFREVRRHELGVMTNAGGEVFTGKWINGKRAVLADGSDKRKP